MPPVLVIFPISDHLSNGKSIYSLFKNAENTALIGRTINE
jgi:hypothetical protein